MDGFRNGYSVMDVTPLGLVQVGVVVLA